MAQIALQGVDTPGAESSKVASPSISKEAVDPFTQGLPSYALQYAPIFHLHAKEEFWPGNPLDLVVDCHPQTATGDNIMVPHDLLGKSQLLALPGINDPGTFLCSNQDPRANMRIPTFVSPLGKPDTSGNSRATCWIIKADKSDTVRAGIVDIFYFLFYPYNYGNSVCFTHFGNHVGDWEHVMIRFENEKPISIHLSAHSEGHSYAWSTMEKQGDRPVVYIANGSHAMYGKAATIYYSIPLLGPADYTSKGPVWDPTSNYIASSYSRNEPNFTNLAAPISTFTVSLAPDAVLDVLNFKGRWGNSFSDLRKGEKWYNIISKKLAQLKWSQGPTGPRDKNLDRVGMNWNNDRLQKKL